MNRVLGVLKDEPPIESMFEVLETNNKYKKGEILYLTDEDFSNLVNKLELYAPNYKKIGTFRQAFVGDMQKRIDEYTRYSNMEYYAENCGRYVEHVYHPVIKYVRVNIFKQFVEFIRDYIKQYYKKKKQKKEDDLWLERQLFGPEL